MEVTRHVLGRALSFILFSVLQISLIFAADFLSADEDNQLLKRELLLQQLSELESPGNANYPAMIEILTSLANASMTLNLYAEASAFLGRSLQIQRRSAGLFSPHQVPIIFTKMQIDASSGNWDLVNVSLDNLYWLVMNKKVSKGDDLIENLVLLTEFHLIGVLYDKPEMQAHHYQEASKIAYQALEIGKRLWGSHDSRLLHLYYGLIKQLYMQAAAIELGDDTAYALRAIVPGSTWVRPRRIVRAGLYRAGLKLFEDMGEVIREGREDSVESMGMLNLYLADWHLLFDKRLAEETYSSALATFKEANLNEDRLDQLLDSPKILPIPNFYESVSSALTAEAPEYKLSNTAESLDTISEIFFQDWLHRISKNSLFIEVNPELTIVKDESTALRFSFRLNSLEAVTHWVNGRYRTNISVAEELRILDDYQGLSTEFINNKLRLLHFRPRFENGSIRPSQGILVYDVASY